MRSLHHHKHEHRDIQGGAARAAVFGVSDGLVSNVGLILGVIGASPTPESVRLAGIAGLVAGGISMAAGEYNSMKVQAELFTREIEVERREIEENPQLEADELANRYIVHGIEPELATEFSESLMEDPELALAFHAREELGVQLDELGSPVAAATSSMAAFAVGAIIPLLPWFVLEGNDAIAATMVCAALGAVLIGWAISYFTEMSMARTVTRQLLFTAAPALLTYFIGSAIGGGEF